VGDRKKIPRPHVLQGCLRSVPSSLSVTQPPLLGLKRCVGDAPSSKLPPARNSFDVVSLKAKFAAPTLGSGLIA
jgi:hypothetical protein